MDLGQVVRLGRWAVMLMAGASLAACATIHPVLWAAEGAQGAATVRPPSSRPKALNAPYQVGGISYVPHEQPHHRRQPEICSPGTARTLSS